MNGQEKLNELRERRKLYLDAERELLTGGAQSYNVGSRSLTRYGMTASELRSAIKGLNDEIEELETALEGRKPRKAVGVVPRDW